MGKLIEVDYEEMYLVDEAREVIGYIDATDTNVNYKDVLKKFLEIYLKYVNDTGDNKKQYKKDVLYLRATIDTTDYMEWHDIFVEFCYNYNIYDDFECYKELVALLIDNYDAPEDKFMPMCRVFRADDGLEEYYCLQIIGEN